MSEEFRKIPTETLLRRVDAARAQGDWTTARREWEACIARARNRVVVVVDRYVYAKRWIVEADHEDTVQDALIRAGRSLVHSLESLSEDSFFAAVVTVADNGLAYTSVAELAGREWSGRALGVQNTLQNLTAVLTAPVLAAVIGDVRYALGFALVAVCPLIAVPLTPARAERWRGSSGEDVAAADVLTRQVAEQ